MFATSAVSTADEVSLCATNSDHTPFINGTDHISKDNPGKAINIAQHAAKASGITLNIIRRPWARCLDLVKRGKVNALMPSAITPQRQRLYQFPSNKQQFLIKASFHIFYANHSAHGAYFEQLAQSQDKSQVATPSLKYGLSAPYRYVVHTRLAELNLLSNHTYDAAQGLSMVAADKLDGYIFGKHTGINKLQELALDKELSVTKEAFLQERLYVPFNKAFYAINKEKIELFWQHLIFYRKQIL